MVSLRLPVNSSTSVQLPPNRILNARSRGVSLGPQAACMPGPSSYFRASNGKKCRFCPTRAQIASRIGRTGPSPVRPLPALTGLTTCRSMRLRKSLRTTPHCIAMRYRTAGQLKHPPVSPRPNALCQMRSRVLLYPAPTSEYSTVRLLPSQNPIASHTVKNTIDFTNTTLNAA